MLLFLLSSQQSRGKGGGESSLKFIFFSLSLRSLQLPQSFLLGFLRRKHLPLLLLEILAEILYIMFLLCVSFAVHCFLRYLSKNI